MAWGIADFIAIGNVCQVPELKQDRNGKATTSFSLAIERSVKKGDEYGKQVYFMNNIRVFGKQAENIVRYATKGTLVTVLGRLDEWVNEEGKKFTTFTANSIHFKGEDRLAEGSSLGHYAEQHGESFGDDGVPF